MPIRADQRADTRTNLELAQALLTMGRAAEAIPVIQSALRAGFDASNFYVTHTDPHEALARAWERAGNPDSAAVHYRRVADAGSNADEQFHARRTAARTRLTALAAATWRGSMSR